MEENKIYDPEASTNLYEDLLATYQLKPNYRRAYQELNRVFLKFLDLNTNFVGIRFGGPFPKTDYLLKEHHASKYLQRTVNDARVRLRKWNKLKDSELAENYIYDFKAVCLFISLIYGVSVPSDLEALFPQDRIVKRAKLKAECIRVIVNDWDDKYIYATADDEGIDDVKVFYGGQSNKSAYPEWDWSYLHSILKKDCQLNLVRPREDGDLLYPELIIWEPDYLVDISAIAACFEDYGTSPLNHLLNKIKPAPNTPHIVLGNLASQFLDEELAESTGEIPYKQSVKKFYKSNALSVLTAELGTDFHINAQAQQINIRKSIKKNIREMLQSDGIQFNSSDIMVEPSFFSEMLGIQGRMDFLHINHKVLIEQKSGKGRFPESDPPKEQKKHYVQLLLYMLLLRYNYHHETHPILFYSKYQKGLLRLAPVPEFIFIAIKVRNEIVAKEYDYTRMGLSILNNLTANSLNINGITGKLWDIFQKPQIEKILAPIHSATPLEQAYYYRFMRFLETEHLMAKIGNQTKENSGFADKWHSSLEDKLLAGNIYCDLELLAPSASENGKIEHVVLGYRELPEHDISNFRKGDIVILYPYTVGAEPDARQSMVFRSTIESITSDKITLNLRSAQANANVFWYHGEKKWAIEHDFFESSYSSLYRGMHAFLSAPKSRRDLLLLQREPQIDRTRGLIADYGNFNELSLKAKQAKDLFLIIGPPGTGKTSYALLNTLEEELLSSQDSVLLLSYTNRAVDEICERLVENNIDFIRIGGKFSCEEKYRPYMLESKVEQCEKAENLNALIKNTRVFVGTTTSFNSNINIFKLKTFGLAIIDEASQILEPHLMGLLSAKTDDNECAIQKMILIGDHKQLPAVVQQKEEESKVEEPALKAIHLDNCRSSLFERLLKQYKNNTNVVYMLTKQGRMHHDIALFPNYTFYQNKLEEVPREHQNILLPVSGNNQNGIEDILLTRRIAFIAIPSPDKSESDKVNKNEARAIAATVVKIYEINKDKFEPLQTVGVIVPYRNQIAEVRNRIEEYGVPRLKDITIDTVERYQGSQRDYIVYGFTIQKYHQLSFLTNHVFEEDDCIIDRKLNVAMTRAREHLIVFGNPNLLANNITFYKLMEFVKSKHGYFSIDLDDYIIGNFSVPVLEKDLDLSQATFLLSLKYEEAFNQCVLEPIKTDCRTEWPDIILGRNMSTNLDAIGYGRINFSNQLNIFATQISPKEQVLIYCYYIMRMHYCSSKTLFNSYKDWFKNLINALGGRLQFIDIGCGPATCGIAFAESFLSESCDMQYTGIDVSVEMKAMGEQLVSSVFKNQLRHRFLSAFGELSSDYWEAISEVPSLIIFNLSYVFSNLDSKFTESLARMISEKMKKYTLNKFVFVVQHSECDKRLNTYKVFKRIISPFVTVYKTEDSEFRYQLNYKERSRDFSYEILISK